MTAQLLDWDSRFFGFPVARIAGKALTAVELAGTLAECRKAGVRLAYLHTQPTDVITIQLMQQAGAWLADRKVTFAMSIEWAEISAPDAAVVLTTTFTPQLESLAWQSGLYSRFALDPRVPSALFQKLYSQWLKNSLNGTLAHAVLTFPDDAGNELGLLTLGEKNGRADIGLLAVDEQARGQRVGTRLVAEARRLAVAIGYTELQVVTQRDNTNACRFYENCGFVSSQEEYIYHLWLD